MKEVYHISGSGNNSGLKLFESEDQAFIIRVPKTLVSKSWRYLLIGSLFLFLSILFPIFINTFFANFYIRIAFFLLSLLTLSFGAGVTAIAIWEIRNSIVITMTTSKLTIFIPAFFRYRSLERTFDIGEISHLYVNKVRVVGREKYSLMIENNDPLDERLIKGFYVPEQALWIASAINKRIKALSTS